MNLIKWRVPNMEAVVDYLKCRAKNKHSSYLISFSLVAKNGKQDANCSFNFESENVLKRIPNRN